jgi:hypothetical protein
MEENKFQFPSEIVELPSKGIIYPEGNPLSSGKIEMKYMTAREEDIITNQNYIQKGIVIDKLLRSLVISDVNLDDLITGDKNAIMVAARVLGYGKDYTFDYLGKDYTVDLSKLEDKIIDESMFTSGINEFEFILPHSQNKVTFQLMTDGLEKKIENELKGLSKINKENLPEMSTRMKYLILSVNGETDRKHVREFVDTALLARDAKALRDYIIKIQPDIKFIFDRETFSGEIEETEIPITSNFFFPND